jgi:hypothetical protein
MTSEEAIEIINDRCGLDKDIPLAILWDLLYFGISIEEAQHRFEQL